LSGSRPLRELSGLPISAAGVPAIPVRIQYQPRYRHPVALKSAIAAIAGFNDSRAIVGHDVTKGDPQTPHP
jgi:hypothetical protein